MAAARAILPGPPRPAASAVTHRDGHGLTEAAARRRPGGPPGSLALQLPGPRGGAAGAAAGNGPARGPGRGNSRDRDRDPDSVTVTLMPGAGSGGPDSESA